MPTSLHDRVVEHSASNKMQSANLAVVFGPTLLRPAVPDLERELADNPHQIQVLPTSTRRCHSFGVQVVKTLLEASMTVWSAAELEVR